MSEIEPVIHSHITDSLPEDHHLASTCVSCDSCLDMLHASNNECMQTWVEFYKWGNFCIRCFGNHVDADTLGARGFDD